MGSLAKDKLWLPGLGLIFGPQIIPGKDLYLFSSYKPEVPHEDTLGQINPLQLIH